MTERGPHRVRCGVTTRAALRWCDFGVADGPRSLLHGVDWGPPRRGFAHVLGPPGAGKTLLLRALARHHLGDGVRFWRQIAYGGVDWRVCAPAALAVPHPPLPASDVATNLLAALPAERLLALLESPGGGASAAARAGGP